MSGDVTAAARGLRRLGLRRPGRRRAPLAQLLDRRHAPRVEPEERPVRALEIRGGAAYELGRARDDHGVKIQPFPDG